MRIALLGAGHIGQTIARLLADTGDYQVTVFDKSPAALSRIAGKTQRPGVSLDQMLVSLYKRIALSSA